MSIQQIKDENFENEALNSQILTLVDFWAEWCGPCKQIGPILEEIAEEKKDRLRIVKLNIDENQQTPQKYGVRGIPTLMLFQDGRLVDSKVGSMPKSSLNEWIESYLNK
jgi:thioredoxin 1